MDSLYQVHIRLRACIQRGVFIMLIEYLQNRLHSRTHMQNVRSHVVRETIRSESNRPRVLREQNVLPEVRNGPLSLRDFFQLFSLRKIATNPMGDPSVLPIQFPIYF